MNMILTKSVSRFARNTVDSLKYVRKLRAMGIGVFFEEQNLDSLKADSEMFIGLYSVMAQAESENISANVKWGIHQRMKSGTYATRFDMLGYHKEKGEEPRIVPEEAEIVRKIFDMYLDGASLDRICEFLNSNGVHTKKGKTEWTRQAILNMLKNEKYVGDVIMQKTFCSDCISKKVRKNNGEMAKYLISNNHPAIVDRDTFNLVQAEISRRISKTKKSDRSVTEQGKYSGKYALTELFICGECGSACRRTCKTVNGAKLYYWRCINRIDNGKQFCKESRGVEERKLQAAICRCLSRLMTYKSEAVELIQSNLMYAVSGDNSVLDAFAIENQIKQYQNDVNDIMQLSFKSSGNTDKYEAEIKKLYDKIKALRGQLEIAKSQATKSDSVNREVARIVKLLQKTDADFTEYDDVVVRRLVECIRLVKDEKIIVILKGGMQGEEDL